MLHVFVMTLLWKWGPVALFSFGWWLVYCLSGFVCSSSWCHWYSLVYDFGYFWTTSILFAIVQFKNCNKQYTYGVIFKSYLECKRRNMQTLLQQV